MALWPCTNINIWSCSGQDCDYRSACVGRLDNAAWIHKVLPVSWQISRWLYDTEEILTHRAVQDWSLIMRQKFDIDRTMHRGVMTTSSPLAKEEPCRTSMFTRFEEMSQFWHGPMTFLSSFELNIVKQPRASRWRCDFKSWFLCSCHQAGTLVLHA